MNTEELLPVLATTAMVAMLAFAVWFVMSSYLARRREDLRRRMAQDEEGEADGLLLRPPLAGAAPGRSVWNFRLLIERTGLELTPASAAALMLLSGVILGGAAFVWRMDVEPWLALPAFLLGVAIPFAIFVWRQGQWRRALQQQLPDMLFLLARSLRAGRSLEQAIGFVGDSGMPPLSREFSRMFRQLDLGIPLDQVVRGSAERVHLSDFYVFSSVLSLHRTTGGNLPVLLDRLAVATRDRTHFEGQYRAATILGRTSTGFIGCMVGLILFYLFFFQREWAMRFFDTSHGYTGVTLFATAAGLEVAGLLLLAFLLQHDY